jgi:hypothetical protein
MIHIAHVIHPGVFDPESDLCRAQPITFQTMRAAREFARGTVKVEMHAVQFQDEARVDLGQGFVRVPDLTRSVMDVKTFKKTRKLALIKDILDLLHAACDNADYLIYTNVDIALQPHFYSSIAQIIGQGHDGFVINRRTIPAHYAAIADIPLMYAEVGESHPGYDCFVFRRETYPQFKLGVICIGTAWIGRALLANMVVHSTKFKEFKNKHLTFHVGDSQAWRHGDYDDYFQENRNEFLRIFRELESEKGGFSPLWRSYLLDTGSRRQFPEFES